MKNTTPELNNYNCYDGSNSPFFHCYSKIYFILDQVYQGLFPF